LYHLYRIDKGIKNLPDRFGFEWPFLKETKGCQVLIERVENDTVLRVVIPLRYSDTKESKIAYFCCCSFVFAWPDFYVIFYAIYCF
jgi:hypothetical protein